MNIFAWFELLLFNIGEYIPVRKINENPLAYVAGAFVGGVIVDYVMGRGKS